MSAETSIAQMRLGQGELQKYDSRRLLITLFHVAWLAILAGLFAQLVVLLLKSIWAADQNSMARLVVDTIHKVSWSVFVCVGLALALIANQARPQLTGFFGMLAAPLAIIIARAAQKSMAQLLNIPVDDPPLQLTLTACVVKALQYLALGFMLGWLSLRPGYRAWHYAIGGFVLGIVFGTTLMGLIYWLAPKTPPTFELISRYVNELIQPVGCCLAYFAAERISKMVIIAKGT